MGKNDWAKLEGSDELASLGVPRRAGRGWKVFSGVLVVASASLAFAYYLPLYRAHAQLRAEYKATSTQAADFRKQLVDAVATLNQTTDECGKLRTEVSKHTRDATALASQIERLERSLQAPLKKFQGKGRCSVERQPEKLRITLAAPALVTPTGSDLSDFGKKALCAVGGGLKDSAMHVVVHGFGVGVAGKTGTAWQVAASRAGNAAELLSKDCGVSSGRIEIAVSPAAASADGAAVALEITPTP